MTKREADATATLNEFAAQLLGLTTHSPKELADKVSHLYPWMLAVRQEDREQCASDLLHATRAALATGQPERVVSEMLSWRETARAVGHGLLASNNDWLESLELVEQPQYPDGWPWKGSPTSQQTPYTLYFATSSARKGWRDVSATRVSDPGKAWDALTHTPLDTTPLNYPLNAELQWVSWKS